ncbi:hypothetical protein N0V82_000331 [Gnomoniopsis sp. IMI 355080]|nr:hypothetical protein N0V82_000331 [Gnomoniopsis sp. IMI 355080]
MGGPDAARTRARLYKAKTSPPSTIATEKRLTENAILAQTPLWIFPVAWVMLTDRLAIWKDTELLIFCTLVAAPSVWVPALVLPPSTQIWPYWLKLHAWVGIVVFFGTYLGTHYFFEFMGMRYTFGAAIWTFDSALGRSGQHVPVFLYPLTHAYFMTYYVAIMKAERILVDSLPQRLSKSVMARVIITLILSYALAFLETLAMAVDRMAPYFAYRDRQRMLVLGSWGYASYFVVGLPMVRRIDEDGEWDMGRVILQATGSCLGIFALLEMWTHVVGPL